jgi:hypothetical protein
LYNASIYRDENGEIIGVFAAARDITERKKAEEALKKVHDNFSTSLIFIFPSGLSSDSYKYFKNAEICLFHHLSLYLLAKLN